MLKFLNRNTASQWIIFLGLLTLAVYTIVTQTQLSNEQGAPFLYKKFAQLFLQYQFYGKVLIIAILLLQILIIQYFFNKNQYSVNNSLLPSCFFISILLLTKSLVLISPLFFTLLFLITITSTNYATASVKLKNNVFWIGIVIALATCLDISSIILLVLVVVTLIINQFFKLKEIAILLFGFGLVYFYFFSYYFFTNNLNEWLLTFKQMKFFGIWNVEILSQTSTIISLLLLSILYVFFMIRTKLVSDSKVVVLRKRAFTINTWSVLMIFCLLISNSTYPHVLGYLFVPITGYLSILSHERNPYYINELVTISTLSVLWFL
jgi:hypothetical protein